MCGIAGFIQTPSIGLSQTDLVNMGDAILHRGPDASATYMNEHVGLVHRRLSIIDLSDAGTQPMYSDDNNLVIVFNGEIYNYLPLRQTLQDKGYPFRSHTDTEVILALYKEYGTDCLAHLNGMFAFAIWDKTEQSLFIARDRIGKKPLYYYHANGLFAFGSELKALLTLAQIPRVIREDAVYDFFAYQYIPDPKTIFTDMHKLPPGHYMIIKDQHCDIQQYWDVSFAQQSDLDEAQATVYLRELLAQCTHSRMLADVDLGAFLSGGVDSGGVVAMMAQASETPVKTCTIGFDDERFNETEFAKIVARQYHTEHHEFSVHQDVAEHLEHIVSFFDEPFGDPSLVPTFFVSQLARQVVKVAIAGDGGDEIFAGYEKYSIDAIENSLREKFPKELRQNLFPALAKICTKGQHTFFRKGTTLLNSLALDPAMGFYLTNSQITDAQWQELVKSEFAARLGDYHPAKITLDAYDKADGPDHLAKILYTDLKTYLPGGILVKVDRMSMANSLEVRAPILDKTVIEFAATLPSKMKYNNGEKKYILKEAFKPLLPDDVLYRKKMGFSVPLATWFREHIKQIAAHYFFAHTTGIYTYFNASTIQQWWDEHQANTHDHSHLLWSLLMFQMWYVKYMDVA
jgi:asparagine synthase (glutamine-hydrolysing)